MKKGIFYIVLAFLLAACTAKEEPQPSSLIVEGWIDAGDYPVVLIHRSYVMANFDEKSDVKNMADAMAELMIPFGKVTVSDRDNEVILTGRIDTAYMPPYTYSSLYMPGTVGKRYTVTVQYQDYYATASTTIPPVATLDSLIVRSSDLDNKIDVRAFMSGVTDPDAYYALFIREFKTKQFQLCPFGVFEGKDAQDGKMEIKVYNPIPDENNNDVLQIHFHKDLNAQQQKSYQVKIARIDYPSYLFWKAYNEQIITRGTLFIPAYKNIPGNVSGGYGIFTGMGSSIYHFSLQNDSIYRF